MPTLTRTLKLGMVGADVEACKRAVYRYVHAGASWNTFVRSAPIVRRTFGVFFREAVKVAQLRLGLKADGQIGPATEKALRKAGGFDLLADRLLDQYAAAQKPPAPKLVKPKQGFGSLTQDLWPAYSIGRDLGLTDVGTFNAQSVLPESRLPSDHATSRIDGRIGEPACAFDLGFSPATGYAHPVARRFFDAMVGRPEVAYVILGTKIWSAGRAGEGVRAYMSGGHEGHVHTSGRRR